MAKIIKQPQTNCFVENPIVFELETDSDNPIHVVLLIDDEQIELSYTPFGSVAPYRVKFDIANILQAYISTQTVVITRGEIIDLVDNFAVDCNVIIPGEPSTTVTLKGFRGGISSSAISELIRVERDMFSYRLNSSVYQYLFTTRTNGHHLVLRETELYPFVFIHPGSPISFVTISGHVITQAALDYGSICSMDFEAVRQMFAKLYGELPSYIVVQTNQQYSFDVTITQAQVTEERIQLLFRNSIGGFEAVDVTGKATDVPEFSEENTWQVFNQENYFQEERDRLTVREKIEVEVGYKSKAELNFIKDLIASDAIYCITGDLQFRCHVTVDSYKIARKINTPTSIPLIIRTITDERFHSPALDFTFPDSHPLANITRSDDDRINGVGLIYSDDNFLYVQ